mmetsp:Transcript_1925/g.3473  ORF Transcript_1925/g.3473 Transcript_1925/m.3473 type:complete len:175 (-) Transcript_1925:247-771(-)
MHWFEAIKFKNNALPPQLVVGHGGTQLIPNYVEQDIWTSLRVEVGRDGLGIFGDIEWGLAKSEYGYAIMDRNANTNDYEVNFYFYNGDTGLVELLEDNSLMIPKGPRVHSNSSGGEHQQTDGDVNDSTDDMAESSGSGNPVTDDSGTANLSALRIEVCIVWVCALSVVILWKSM